MSKEHVDFTFAPNTANKDYGMDLLTQISSGYGENLRSVFKLKQKLQNLNINVTHPIGGGSIYINEGLEESRPNNWQPYEIYLDYYSSLANSDFHIIYNELRSKKGFLNNDMAREVLYAMSKRKPVILLYPPLFQSDVETFSKKLIEHYLDQIVVCDLTILDDFEVKRLLHDVAKSPAAYALTSRESMCIKRLVREYFSILVKAYGKTVEPPIRSQ